MNGLESWAEHALDQIDAGIFSGDTFQNPDARAHLRAMMERWERQLKLDEASEAEDKAL